MFGRRQIEERVEALERNLVEAIVRAESAEAVAFALLGRELEKRFEQRRSATAYMRSMQAEFFRRVKAVKPDHLGNEIAEYLGPMLQPYWSAAEEYDEENGLRQPSETSE